jgi:NAD(P)-dependent dehydrogenase (short-subunit alcohol dehydrogenase family)
VKEGAHVFIFGRRRDALDEAVQLIGANVTAIQADASRLEDLDRVADAVRSAKGKVDVVVSNAALVEQVPLLEITPDHYDRTFALNAKGPLFLVQKMLPMMGSGGSIILRGLGHALHGPGEPLDLRRHQGGAAFVLSRRAENQLRRRVPHLEGGHGGAMEFGNVVPGGRKSFAPICYLPCMFFQMAGANFSIGTHGVNIHELQALGLR